MSRPVQCPYCPKRFADNNAAWQHCKTKHRGKERRQFAAPRVSEPDEQSLADELIDAQLDHAMGLPVDEALRAMFPDQFGTRT